MRHTDYRDQFDSGCRGDQFLFIPKSVAALVTRIAAIDDRAMRIMGLFSMLLGLALLYLFNN